jgi:hypothetical protein
VRVLAFLLVTMVVVLAAAASLAAEPVPETARSSSEWAELRLPTGSYELVEGDHGITNVVLRRAVTVFGCPCAADSEIAFTPHGRVRRADLDRDTMVDGIPLRGGTRVAFDPMTSVLRSGTLSRSTVIGTIPCAAAPIAVFGGRRRLRVARATLSRDTTIEGVACRGETEVVFDEGIVAPRLRSFTPRVTHSCWHLRCAAEHPIDRLERSGTLADDHVYDGVTFPAGSRFAHDIDWGQLEVTATIPVEVTGHTLPSGTTICPAHDLVAPVSRWRRLGRRWWSSEQPLVRARRNETWWLGGAHIERGWCVRIGRDGLATIRLASDHLASGVRYPAGSIITVDPHGRVRRWEAGPRPHREPSRGPYRSV